MTDKEYLVALSSFVPFGPARIKLLTEYFGSAKTAWKTSHNKFLEIGLSNRMAKDFIQYRDSFKSDRYFEKLRSLKIDYVTINDTEYPENLKGLSDAPTVLYIRGKLKKGDVNAVAIVGSRKMTTYGREVTERLSKNLSSFGITIVSGLAFGIDLAAHKSALEEGGRCIAVLASGIDMITPRSNEWMGLKIIKSGGAVISEFPLGLIPQRHFFPFRNRIISGLSKAIVVVEGMIKSGTIHTANHAALQGRTVFAVPGQITSPLSELPLYLIKNGAKVVTEAKDVLEELGIEAKVNRKALEEAMPMTTEEEKLIQILENEALHLDEIARISTLDVSAISSRLTIMELKGMVRNIGKGVYKKI